MRRQLSADAEQPQLAASSMDEENARKVIFYEAGRSAVRRNGHARGSQLDQRVIQLAPERTSGSATAPAVSCARRRAAEATAHRHRRPTARARAERASRRTWARVARSRRAFGVAAVPWRGREQARELRRAAVAGTWAEQAGYMQESSRADRRGNRRSTGDARGIVDQSEPPTASLRRAASDS